MNRFRKLLVMIFLLTPWWMSSVALAQQVEERVVINFKGDKLPADLEAQIQVAGGALVRTLPEVGIAVAVSTDPNFTSAITASKDVTSAGVLPFYSSSLLDETVKESTLVEEPQPQDVYFNNGSLWGIYRVNAPQAWSAGYTGSHQTVVAVVDTGIAWNHPDLAPNIVHTGCYTTAASCNPYPAAGEICTATIPPAPGRVPCVEFNHGTHVAGTIAAAFGGEGFVGVGPNLGLASYKVSEVQNGHLVAAPDSVWTAMMDAADRGYQVINFSWGWCYVIGGGDPNNIAGCIQQIPDTLKGSKDVTAFNRAAKKVVSYVDKKGAVIVAAAGNFSFDLNGTNGVVPADLPQVIGVSATGIRQLSDPPNWPFYPQDDAYDVLAWYSNFGASGVTVTAPGGDCGPNCDPNNLPSDYERYRILSTAVALASCQTPPNSSSPPTSSCCNTALCRAAPLAFGGTSMATPHVAGIIGLVRDANPNLTPNQVRALIKTTADDLGDHQSFGHGMVNAYEAVLKAVR